MQVVELQLEVTAAREKLEVYRHSSGNGPPHTSDRSDAIARDAHLQQAIQEPVHYGLSQCEWAGAV